MNIDKKRMTTKQQPAPSIAYQPAKTVGQQLDEQSAAVTAGARTDAFPIQEVVDVIHTPSGDDRDKTYYAVGEFEGERIMVRREVTTYPDGHTTTKNAIMPLTDGAKNHVLNVYEPESKYCVIISGNEIMDYDLNVAEMARIGTVGKAENEAVERVFNGKTISRQDMQQLMDIANQAYGFAHSEGNAHHMITDDEANSLILAATNVAPEKKPAVQK